MRHAHGTPVLVSGDEHTKLKRVNLGGPDGRHDEKWLQQLIHRHPECLPTADIEPGLPELISVCMELPLPSGSLDNLLITSDGDIVIVEAKLWRNPQAKREVVAQALDYANSLFGMDYETFEKAVLKADFGGKKPPARLYDILTGDDALDEAGFINAVNKNLSSGRIVILVAGDGIQPKAAALVEGLQAHAGFHFTFALVELAVFQAGESGDLFVAPRTMLQTEMVERGIVSIVRTEDGQTPVITPPSTIPAASGKSKTKQSITSEKFYEAVDEKNGSNLSGRLKIFVERLSEAGVWVEFNKTMIFRWLLPNGASCNLGYINSKGELYADDHAKTDSASKIRRAYMEALAGIFGDAVKFKSDGVGFINTCITPSGDGAVTPHFDAWFDAVEQLQKRFREEDQEV